MPHGYGSSQSYEDHMLASNTNGCGLTSISCLSQYSIAKERWTQQWQPQKHTRLQTLPENIPRLVKHKVLHFIAPYKASSLHYTKEWPHSRPSNSWHLNKMPCKSSFQQLWLCFEGLWLCPESQCFCMEYCDQWMSREQWTNWGYFILS